MFDTRCYDCAFRLHKGNCLTLHVRTHERTVGIVVFKERNERGRYRNELFGRNVHIIHLIRRILRNQIAVAATDMGIFKAVGNIQRFVSLSDYKPIFFVGGEIIDVVGYPGIDNLAFSVQSMLNLSVRTHYKAVFVYLRESCKRRNKTYILTFGRFYRAKSAVMRVVNVAHVESSSFAVKTAGTERRQLTLMGKLCSGVGLVHELRQL